MEGTLEHTQYYAYLKILQNIQASLPFQFFVKNLISELLQFLELLTYLRFDKTPAVTCWLVACGIFIIN